MNLGLWSSEIWVLLDFFPKWIPLLAVFPVFTLVSLRILGL